MSNDTTTRRSAARRPKPQSKRRSLSDQLGDLAAVADALKMNDAADWLREYSHSDPERIVTLHHDTLQSYLRIAKRLDGVTTRSFELYVQTAAGLVKLRIRPGAAPADLRDWELT